MDRQVGDFHQRPLLMVQTSSVFLGFLVKMHYFSSDCQITIQPSVPQPASVSRHAGLIESLAVVFRNWSQFQAGRVSVSCDYFETGVEGGEVQAYLECENCGFIFGEEVAFASNLLFWYLFPGTSFGIRIVQ